MRGQIEKAGLGLTTVIIQEVVKEVGAEFKEGTEKRSAGGSGVNSVELGRRFHFEETPVEETPPREFDEATQLQPEVRSAYLKPLGPAFRPSGKKTPVAGLTTVLLFTAPPPVTMLST